MVAVAAELHADIFRAVKGEQDGLGVGLPELYVARRGAYHHGQRVGLDDLLAQQFHAHIHFPFHVKLSKGCRGEMVHVHVAGVDRNILPFASLAAHSHFVGVILFDGLPGIDTHLGHHNR